jgi:Right handed beta helix region
LSTGRSYKFLFNVMILGNTDRLTIEGNIISRCRGAIELGYDLRDWAQEILITGNLISGNYNGGLSFYANGVVLTGNQISKNGHGGINGVTSTIEPGIKIDPSYPGSSYVAEDILTLSGGTGTPAKVMVVSVFTGGTLYEAPGTDSALWPIDMGSYTSFPPNPVVVSGGHGSGARAIYTNSKIGAAGSGYAVGDVLRATNPGYTQVVRVVVTAVSSGAVTGYDILNGGGYSGALPSSLAFANDWGSGTGFTLIPAWGKRYSRNYAWTFGVEVVGPLVTGIISGNTISSNNEAPGILFYDQPPLFTGRAQQFVITSNILRDNAYSIKGKTGAGAFDDTWPSSNIIANNIGYP